MAVRRRFAGGSPTVCHCQEPKPHMAVLDAAGQPNRDEPGTGKSPTSTEPASTLPAPSNTQSSEDPNPDEPYASPRSEPPPPPASDADKCQASSSGPPARPDHHWHNGVTTHAPSDGPPHTDEPHQSPSHPQGPPTPPDTSAPQHSAPPTRQDLLREFREGWNQEVSPTYRSHCRPGTGTASTKWNPPTGATMSSINRSCTWRFADRVKFRYLGDPLAPVARRPAPGV